MGIECNSIYAHILAYIYKYINKTARKKRRRRLGLFRAIHFKEVAVNMTDYIQPHPHQSSTRRHEQQYLIPHCNTDVHKKSFFVSTAKLWNNLSCDCSLLVGPPVAG